MVVMVVVAAVNQIDTAGDNVDSLRKGRGTVAAPSGYFPEAAESSGSGHVHVSSFNPSTSLAQFHMKLLPKPCASKPASCLASRHALGRLGSGIALSYPAGG